jgi:hypothetical protein
MMMKLNKYLILIVIMVSVLGCKTKESQANKTKEKSHLKTNESGEKKGDSVAVKKETTEIKTEQKNNINYQSDKGYSFIKYLPILDINGKQLIDTKEEGTDKSSLSDQSTFSKQEVKVLIDSIGFKWETKFQLFKDGIGESQTKTKQVDSDSTLATNVPWWVWLIGIVGLIIFLAFKFK